MLGMTFTPELGFSTSATVTDKC
uniref:Uncharacterized protein n=1 Tax=Anguilla anguilla TaxID=7936 RepID=A0A0E9TPQ0_ANGAN